MTIKSRQVKKIWIKLTEDRRLTWRERDFLNKLFRQDEIYMPNWPALWAKIEIVLKNELSEGRSLSKRSGNEFIRLAVQDEREE